MTHRSRRRWLPEEERSVDWHWGEERLATTADRVGRSVTAIRRHFQARGLPSAVVRGRVTINQVAEDTGYNWHDVERAIRGAGIRPIRTCDTPRGRRTLLTEEQVQEVIAYLGQETAEADDRPTVAAIAYKAQRSRRTAYAWVLRLELDVDDGRLEDEDAELLLATLLSAPAQPPPGSLLTVRAIAADVGVSRRCAYVWVRKLELETQHDATLLPEHAAVLRSALQRVVNARRGA